MTDYLTEVFHLPLTWKDLRSGMACHLFSLGWYSDDINLRLGHSISSRELDVYLNYMAQNRKRAKKILCNNSLEDLKNDLEEARQREKLLSARVEGQKQDIKDQGLRILDLEAAIQDNARFDDVATQLLTDEALQKIILRVILKKGLEEKLTKKGQSEFKNRIKSLNFGRLQYPYRNMTFWGPRFCFDYNQNT